MRDKQLIINGLKLKIMFNVSESMVAVNGGPKTYPKGYTAHPIVTIILIVPKAEVKDLLLFLAIIPPASPECTSYKMYIHPTIHIMKPKNAGMSPTSPA